MRYCMRYMYLLLNVIFWNYHDHSVGLHPTASHDTSKQQNNVIYAMS